MTGRVIEDGVVIEEKATKAKYTPDMCDKIIAVASKGGHIPAMMMAIGVKSKDTWYRWIKDYPEFKEAVEFAKISNQAFMEDIGMRAIVGTIPNFNSPTYALVMHNKFKEDYKRDTGGGDHVEVTINNLNLTSEEISLKIAQKLQKLKGLGVDLGQQED